MNYFILVTFCISVIFNAEAQPRSYMLRVQNTKGISSHKFVKQ